MKNCSKDSHVNHNNRQNSFHAIDRLKIQHIDILKLYFLNLKPMTKSSMVSKDVKNWNDFDYCNCIGNDCLGTEEKF